MKKLYVFDFSETIRNNKLLMSLLILAGHNVITLAELSDTPQAETGMEGVVSGDTPEPESKVFNPKEILFVNCKKPEKLSSRFTSREIDYQMVLEGVKNLSWRMRFTAEKIIASLMGLELPRFYEILGTESEDPAEHVE